MIDNEGLLVKHIESLIFCASEPISLEDIQRCLGDMFITLIPLEEIQSILARRITYYQENDDVVFEIVRLAGGYQFLTKPAYQASITVLLKQKSRKRLSTAALETLSIVAYRQPVTKGQIEQIRGVNCDYALQKLLERELIHITGKADTVGRPVLYGTTRKFMEHFGINSLSDLPQLKDVAEVPDEAGILKED